MDNAVTALQPRNAAAIRAAAPAEAGTSAATPGWWAALPGKAKMSIAAGTAALLAVVVALALWTREGSYAPLFANLSDKDAAAVAAQLSQMNVPYRIADGTQMLMVPAERVPELRLKLAQAGLPKGTVNGYELMDNQSFGQTQQQERNMLKRALEGELVRSITSLAAVQSARVHLALPSQNGFFREQQKPSASVLVTLHAGRTLDRAQVAGIVNLVSSSVPELSAKAVSVLDQNANLLSGPGEAGTMQGLDTQQLQYVQQVEAGYLKRVIDILEPVVGRDNLRATVTAEVDFTQLESTSEAFKPNQGAETAAVRSQTSTEQSQGGSTMPTGVPGAMSNQPPAAATAPAQGASSALHAAQGAGLAGGGARRDSAVNYEVDKTVSVRRNATGVVKRLNAAVLVNHRVATDAKGKTTSTPLAAEELDKLTALVQESLGYSKERGDSIKVVNIPFRVEPAPKAEEVPFWKQPWLQDLARAWAAPAALVVVAAWLVFAVIRPAMRAVAPPPAPGSQVDAVVGDADAAAEAEQHQPLALEAPMHDKRLDDARNLAKQHPAAVANVVRDWFNGEAT